MDVQAAIDAARFVEFVATQWNQGSLINDLTGKPVLNPNGQPVVAGKNYTVLKTIYSNDLATDISIDRPAIEGVKTMGMVAVNDANPSDLVVAIRGTLTVWEWLQDARFLLRPYKWVEGAGLTEDGFTAMYDSFSFTPGTFLAINNQKTFMDALIALIPTPFTPTTRVLVTGHSLGAGIATLLALDLASHSLVPNTCITLASPRVGDHTFMELFNHVVPNAYRVANRLDIVPKVPPPLMYFHVGDETELVPSAASHLKFDIGCEHHLTTYMHLLAMSLGTQGQYPLQANCMTGAPALPGMPEPSAP